MNIKYKKKYHKYKNKYYKIIQNNKLTGGGVELGTISAVVSTIFIFIVGGRGIYMNIDAIKEWINKKVLQVKQALSIEGDKRRNDGKLAELELKKAQAGLDLLSKKTATQFEIAKQDARFQIKHGIAIPATTGGLLLTQEGIPQNESTMLKRTYYYELNYILKKNRENGEEIKKSLQTGVTNLTVTGNPITQQQQLHWDFNTRHFYWTPNIINTDKTVYIKYYPKFGDPNDISVYELLTANTFNLYTGKINKLLSPPPPPAAGQKNTN